MRYDTWPAPTPEKIEARQAMNAAYVAAIAALPAFDPARGCPKCGAGIVPVRYKPEAPAYPDLRGVEHWSMPVYMTPAHMVRTCPTCGHSWRERPLDVESKPAEATP